MAEVCSFRSLVYFCLWSQNFFFLSYLLSFLDNSATLSYDGADFEFLSLGFLEQEKSLKPWVCTFEKVLWDKLWLLEQ